MAKISACICCHNNQATIEAACRSVSWADELVVVDSGSSDATREIAGRYAHQIVVEPWRGFSGQKKFATELCTHDWVLVLDSDEEVTAELASEIRGLSDAMLEAHDVWVMRRRTWMYGRVVRAWLPDWQSRLIHRQRVTWTEHALHEDRLPTQASRLKKLRGMIEHKRHNPGGLADYFSGARLDARVLPVAQQMYAQGKRCRWWHLVLRPWAAFFKLYVLKGGFMQGTFGLMIAQKTAWGVQLKYAALWVVEQEAKRQSQASHPGHTRQGMSNS